MTETLPAFGELPLAELDPSRLGRKGYWLHRLVLAGEAVPAGFVLDPDTLHGLALGDEQAQALLQAAVDRLGAVEVSVRSSPSTSLPGLLPTELNVAPDAVAASAVRVHAALADERVRQRVRAAGKEPEQVGSSVVVQAMVAPAGPTDFACVAFSCDPNTGEARLRGEYKPGAPVAELVTGRSRPLPLREGPRGRGQSLEATQPEALQQLAGLLSRAETLLRGPVEVEALMAGGRLWVLQARRAKLSARGAVQVASRKVAAGEPPDTALEPLAGVDLSGLVAMRLPASDVLGVEPLARGIAASPGVASGALVLDSDRACEAALDGRDVILARTQADPEDVDGFRAARGVLTTSGGLTSHAAVIARGLGRCAVVGCRGLRLDRASQAVLTTDEDTVPERLLREGDPVTVDGYRGLVYPGLLVAEPDLEVPGLPEVVRAALSRWAGPVWCVGSGVAAVDVARRLGLAGVLLTGPLEACLGAADAATPGFIVLESPDDLPRAQSRTLPEGWSWMSAPGWSAPGLARAVDGPPPSDTGTDGESGIAIWVVNDPTPTHASQFGDAPVAFDPANVVRRILQGATPDPFVG